MWTWILAVLMSADDVETRTDELVREIHSVEIDESCEAITFDEEGIGEGRIAEYVYRTRGPGIVYVFAETTEGTLFLAQGGAGNWGTFDWGSGGPGTPRLAIRSAQKDKVMRIGVGALGNDPTDVSLSIHEVTKGPDSAERIRHALANILKLESLGEKVAFQGLLRTVGIRCVELGEYDLAIDLLTPVVEFCHLYFSDQHFYFKFWTSQLESCYLKTQRSPPGRLGQSDGSTRTSDPVAKKIECPSSVRVEEQHVCRVEGNLYASLSGEFDPIQLTVHRRGAPPTVDRVDSRHPNPIVALGVEKGDVVRIQFEPIGGGTRELTLMLREAPRYGDDIDAMRDAVERGLNLLSSSPFADRCPMLQDAILNMSMLSRNVITGEDVVRGWTAALRYATTNLPPRDVYVRSLRRRLGDAFLETSHWRRARETYQINLDDEEWYEGNPEAWIHESIVQAQCFDAQEASVLFEDLALEIERECPHRQDLLLRCRFELTNCSRALGRDQEFRRRLAKLPEPGSDEFEVLTSKSLEAMWAKAWAEWMVDLGKSNVALEALLAYRESMSPNSLMVRDFDRTLVRCYLARGDADEAERLLGSVAERVDRRPEFRILRLEELHDVAHGWAALGMGMEARRWAGELERALRAWLSDHVGVSRREQEVHVFEGSRYVNSSLSIKLGSRPLATLEDEENLFQLIESLRRMLRGGAWGEEDALTRSAIRVATDRMIEAMGHGDIDGFHTARREKEELEGHLVGGGAPRPSTSISSARILSRLRPDEAAVGYWVFDRAVELEEWVPTVGVWVLRPGQKSRFTTLGTLDEIEEAIAEWRGRFGVPLHLDKRLWKGGLRDRLTCAETLRQLILDPVLEQVEGASRLFVAVDNIMDQVPLDALPFKGSYVGDHMEIVRCSSLSDIRLEKAREDAGSSRFLAVAGSPDVSGEIEDILRMFEGEKRVLEGLDLSRETVLNAASHATLLHMASHGELIDWTHLGDPSGILGDQRLSEKSVGERVRDFAPGLLATFLLPRDERRITAEDLAGSDLANCELAVVAICGSGEGYRSLHRGVASLEWGLDIAGARATLTTLWSVPDKATQRLMKEFYRHYLEEGATKTKALWEAKRSLREDPAHDYGLAAWAGWVLAGDIRSWP